MNQINLQVRTVKLGRKREEEKKLNVCRLCAKETDKTQKGRGGEREKKERENGSI